MLLDLYSEKVSTFVVTLVKITKDEDAYTLFEEFLQAVAQPPE